MRDGGDGDLVLLNAGVVTLDPGRARGGGFWWLGGGWRWWGWGGGAADGGGGGSGGGLRGVDAAAGV